MAQTQQQDQPSLLDQLLNLAKSAIGANAQLPDQAPIKADASGTNSGTNSTAPNTSASQAAPLPQPGASVVSPKDIVTQAILNQGQLIPSGGSSGASGSSDKSGIQAVLGELNKAMNSGSNNAAPASSSKSSGAGIIGDVVSGVTKALIPTIICTELNRQGKLPLKYLRPSMLRSAMYPRFVMDGYYVWAIPSVKYIRKYPNSLYAKFLKVIFNWRAENIAFHYGIEGARKLKRGAAITAFLAFPCVVLGVFSTLFEIDYHFINEKVQ